MWDLSVSGLCRRDLPIKGEGAKTKTRVRVVRRLAGLVLLALMLAVPSAFAAPGVQPTVVDTDANAGTSFDVTKT